MRLKTFRAFTLNEALEAAKADLGEEVAILHTRTFKRGGFLGIGGREIVEIIASESEDPMADPMAEPATDSDGDAATGIDPIARAEVRQARTRDEQPRVTTAATRAYAAAAAPTPDVRANAAPGHGASGDHLDHLDHRDEDEAPASGSLEVDREKTRTLARALAIRLERQQAARSSAGVSGPDDVIEPAASSAEAGAMSAPQATDAVPSPSPSPLPSPPPRDAAEHFVIGPGGVLVPDGEAAPPAPSTPRVIELAAAPEPVSPAAIDDRVESVVPVIPVIPVIETFETEIRPEIVVDVMPSPATEPASLESNPVESEVDELDAIRSTVGRLLAAGGAPTPDAEDPASVSGGRSDALADAYASLIAQELSRDLAERVVTSLQEELDEASLEDPEVVRTALLGHLATLVPTAEDLEFTRPRDGRPRTIAFVGPTGVGKTTTLAKIAATMTLRDEIKVGLVTSDTYRIAAVDQLRTYAEILGLRLEIASTPVEMRAALERCADLDAVLIDTPGRSQNDTDRIADLRALVDAARPHETHLVLSGTAAERVLLREAEAFSTLGPDRVVLTKLDEAVTFGMLVSVVRRIGRRISWVTTGQEVPTDVERATSHRLANLMLGESVKS
jgi:flagellar biosynthesis protein FlhF